MFLIRNNHKLSSKVKRRPLFRLLDGFKGTIDSIELENAPGSFAVDSSIEIHVKKGESVSISATAQEPFTEISVDITNSPGLSVSSSSVPPREESEGLFMGGFFCQLMQILSSQDSTGDIPVGEISMAFEDSEWLDSHAGMDVAVQQGSSLACTGCETQDTILALPPMAALPALAPAPTYLALPPSPEPLALPAAEMLTVPSPDCTVQNSANVIILPPPPTILALPPAERRVMKNMKKFFVTEQLGVMQFPPDYLTLGNYNRVGSPVIKLGKKDRIVNVFSHDERIDALLLDPCGKAYCISANSEFEETHLEVLKRGGILLPMDRAVLGDSQLIIVSESGKLRHIPMDEARTIRRSGKQLVDPSSNSSDLLSAACFCPQNEGVILVSSDGIILCLSKDDMSFKKVIKAMNLEPGARIVSCLPYTDNLSVLCVSSGGMVYATQLNLKALHKGSKGVILMKLEGNDTVAGVVMRPDAFLLLRSDSSVLCLRSDEMGLTGRGSKGRQGMKLKSGQSVFGILPLALEQ